MASTKKSSFRQLLVNTSALLSIILIDGRKTGSEWTQTLDVINTDSNAGADQPAGERPSESGFVEIFFTQLGRLKRIIAGMGLNASDAEDVLQDVSIRALNQPGKYRSAEETVQWLIKVTVNRCLTEHRRRRRFQRQASEILKRLSETKTRSAGPHDKAINAEELEIVRETLQQLDESLLTVMVLRYFCDMNSKDIGEILALNPSTVRSRLRAARMLLAERLIERGIEP